MKMHRPHIVPLPRDTLSKALRETGFQGKHATHGFRTALSTIARERMGIDSDVLEAQLAHAKRGDVQQAYDRTEFTDERRRVMQEWAEYLDKLRANGPIAGTGAMLQGLPPRRFAALLTRGKIPYST